ncbi:N-acetylneuraminate synthase family protein [Candidatus Pelagibacter sp. HIMB1521]|uniref:N-acetylneuraminate synthase family protein n=1 Tax=Candidatus Pelagibacter sp. HIMB1521 TaxID=3413344 RepID=UPI003F8694BF
MIKIGKRIISNNSKPLIVAEIGINHFGSLALAKKIVDEAKKNKVEAIKVQIHIPEEEMNFSAKRIKPGNSKLSIFEVIKKNSLSLNDEKKLKEYIHKKKLIYIATPFSFKAVDWLIKNNIKIIKVGSGECNNTPLIEYICKFKIPMIVSTGMNSLDSVKRTVKIINKNKIPHALLHCVNLYPTKKKLIRMNRMLKMMKVFKKSIIGYSDHSIGNNMSILALSLGAKIIEKHFVLNKNRVGPDTICSMDGNDHKKIIQARDEIYSALSSNKEIINEEDITRNFAFHSIVAAKDIGKNIKIKREDITTKRPGVGDYLAFDIKKVLGKKTVRKIKKDDFIKKNYLKK